MLNLGFVRVKDHFGPKESCAVFGASSKRGSVFQKIYVGLYSLQHRGQESAGIAVSSRGRVRLHKAMGLVSEVFKGVCLEGRVGIGHVRYSTTGESRIENSQPISLKYAKGSLAIAHNGNLVNFKELRNSLEAKGCVFSTTTDTEVIGQLFIREHLEHEDFLDAILCAMEDLRGSYCLVILHDSELYVVRDPWGFRPLVLGADHESYIAASETCSLDALEAEFLRDIEPGEVLRIAEGETESKRFPQRRVAHCMFEYVYFARPDSVLNGVSVYEVRKKLGEVLWEEAPAEAELVTAVPDSGITTAIGYARASGIPYGESLIKNRYFGRTFILPEQEQREMGVKVKLNPIGHEIRGKRIVLVDDSIVRGTTISRIVGLLKSSGAKEVHVRIACPPIKYPCFYGIDMQTSKEFIARGKGVEEIRRLIGADSLAYTSLKGLVEAIGLPKGKLCLACLTGEYPVSSS